MHEVSIAGQNSMATCDTFQPARRIVCTGSSISSAEHLPLSTCGICALADAWHGGWDTSVAVIAP